MNHPVVNLGYRIECNGKSVFFTGDHEPYTNIYEPGDEGYAEYQQIIEQKQAEIDAIMRGVDVLIVDASYTVEEYPAKRGWGHSTWQEGVRLCQAAGAKRLVVFHHDPDHDDDTLDAIAREVEQAMPGSLLAREGLVLEV